MATKEEKLQELINKAVEGYNDNQKNLLYTTIRGLVAEAQAKNVPLEIDKPAGGYSLEEIVNTAKSSIDQLTAKPSVQPNEAPKEEDKTPTPPSNKEKGKKDPQVLPSGARVPDDIDASEVVSIEVTNPITLGETKKIVEARRRLKAAQQTSKQDTQSMEKLKEIIADINKPAASDD
jgi:hypothetical protein